MKTCFVKSENIANLQTALGRMIEYAKMLEDETGRSYDSFVDQIILEENIAVKTEEV